MTYLSRIILSARDRLVQQSLGDCHRLHRLVLGGFPEVAEGERARERLGVLFRAESYGRDPSLIRVLVQSDVAPDWSGLPDRILGPDPDGRGNPAVRPLDGEYARIVTGTPLVFRLRANPTRCLSDRTPGRADPLVGKRVALLREDEQLAWLARKGGQHGFRLLETAVAPEVPDARAAQQGITRGWRRMSTGEARPLTFGAVLFEGRLEVTDRDAFLSALRGGIGRGKAFGFGLLSIAGTR